MQVMESAARKMTNSRRLLNSLAKCVEQGGLDASDRETWKVAKEKRKRLFKPALGGSFEVVEQRPVPDEIVAYCVGDVQCLPVLWTKFRCGSNRLRDLVNEETKRRIESTHELGYNPHGREKALARWSRENNRILDELNCVPPSQQLDEDDG